jgi:hypothetical protein
MKPRHKRMVLVASGLAALVEQARRTAQTLAQ